MVAHVLPQKLAGRYDVKDVLGQGGMGLVYRAYDTVIRREVALKTLRDIPEPNSLQLFYKETGVLASISHPNIVEIFDIGEFEENGKQKPYFVMPLLPGTTLDNLIRNASHRLTAQRTVEIISQVCRGLQAAHERGLVHRDLKPSNIFVMEDDSVKIIDFGVAHMTNAHSTVGLKGTLLYMSPEQIEGKPLSALSDLFSLSVVCYEALTGRHPFRRASQDEIVEAILRQIPPPASEVNSAVSQSISRVVHKGMAKQTWHRFSTARDFGETLNKALRNEPIECFDAAQLRPRLERATRALEEGDYQYAGELLSGLEAEGHIDSSIEMLRRQLDRSVRQKNVAQLLSSAKARFEEEEDPLALQKIQEILQLEPGNAAAMGLKSKIESRRSERQIESWYRLAQQHVENHAYIKAREALQNVLQLKPTESRAMQLLAEVDRQEQEYNKLRQEKKQLHRAAVDSWQQGEISNALTKLAMVLELDRRAPDSSSPERNSYQSFYDQVRSEHDALNNAYAEACKHRADGNLNNALQLCDTWLTKYPNNALLQALKYDLEEQRRQELSAFIATVDRQVEGEPDLDKRVGILKEALAAHPDENHFQRALRLVEDKRDLVNSIVARAHFHEEQGQFGDALADWEILRTIYRRYPGLKFEVERLEKRRENQARTDAKARWAEQIGSCLKSGAYSRAVELWQQAELEFPNDAELAELKKTADAGIDHAMEAQRLTSEGNDLCSKNQFSEGIQLLRRAYELDEKNAVARTVLSNALVEWAQVLVDEDWHAAEDLVQQALDLNPGHPLARNLRTVVLDRKREHLVDECLSRARRLRAAADLAGAMASITEALATYPTEKRLLQIRDTLQNEMAQAEGSKTRSRDLEELSRLKHEAEKATDLATVRSCRERAKGLAANYPDDEEFRSLVNSLGQLAMPAGNRAPSETSGATEGISAGPSATKLFSPAGATTAKTAQTPGIGLPSSGRPTNGPGTISGPAPSTTQPSPLPAVDFKSTPVANRSRSFPTNVAAVVAGSVVLLLAMTLVVVKILRRPPPPPPPSIAVHIHTSPPGATIRINNEVRGASDIDIKLPIGNYQIEAQLDGYQTANNSFEARAGAPSGSIDLTLQPELPVVKLTADTGAGKVSLDDKPAAELDGAQWTAGSLAPGAHQLKFAGSRAEASFTFTTDPGALPAITGPLTAKGMHAVVVSNWGNHLRVYYSDSHAKVSLDNQSDADVGSDGVDIPNVSPGAHQLTLKQGSDSHTVPIDVGTVPTLTAFLVSDQDIGTLMVVTGEDNVQVYLNNQLQKRLTQGGQLRIPNLAPKNYVVRVVKSGFETPAEQQAALHKGDVSQLKFTLKPLQHLASFVIEGGASGVEVFLDGAPTGTVEDGKFALATVSPGDHVIELRKAGFNSKTLRKHFVAGSTVSVGGAEAALDVTTGQLKVTFSPADAVVTIVKNGENPIKISSGTPVTAPPGSYQLTARVGNFPRSAPFELLAGESRTIGPLSFAPGGMEDFDDAAGWKSNQGWFVHRGGGFVLYKTSPTSGTFVFSARLNKGHRLQWVFNYTDDHNYALFQMDENYFYRSEVRGGRTTEEAKIPFKTDKKKSRTFQIVVTPNRILHQIQQGDGWSALDSWNQSGANLSSGNFGFYLPGSDEVELSNFSHYGELKLR
ncbi:MAG TPA: protein kinase [Terriglobales bacterium]|nr:protein kinase [Terriglobales bacterium]